MAGEGNAGGRIHAEYEIISYPGRQLELGETEPQEAVSEHWRQWKEKGEGTGRGDGELEAGEEWAERDEEEKRDQTGTEKSRKTQGGDNMAVT